MQRALMAAVLVYGGAVAGAEVPKIEPPLEAGPLREGPPVGFVTHPHMGDHGNLKALAETPATAELSNVFGWRMLNEPKPDEPFNIEDLRVDFSIATEWLREVYRSGRTAYPILDTGIHHSESAWRRAITERAGQNVVGYDGVTRHWSSFHSPLYRESVFHYVDQLIDWVKLNDTENRIPGYLNGAEWFWPYGTHDFSTLAIEAFRAWLKAKYGTIEAVNQAWGASFADWSEVEPVRPWGAGEFSTSYGTYSLGGPAVYTWASPSFAVEQGKDLRIAISYETSGVAEGLVDAVALWMDDNDEGISLTAWALNVDGNAGRFETYARPPRPLVERPATPTRMRLLLRLNGGGKVTFSEPSVRDAITGVELLPQSEWGFHKSGEATGQLDARGPRMTIEGTIPEPPYARSGIAHDDWIAFTYESMADWLDVCARYIKERDPSRQVVSYVGWVFAMQCQWAGALQEQRLDISLANSPNIEVNGIQMCIAGDDYTYATFLIDMARKYDKPMVTTDLIDFPYGLFSGFEPIYRGSLASVQHGLDGFFYYNWWGTRDYSYSDHLSKGELDRMLRDSRSAIEALAGARPVVDAAVISPILPYSLLDEGGRKGDPHDAGGLYRLVLDLGITPDVWTPYEIGKRGADALKAYSVVFLSDCPVLPIDVNAALVEYVRGGGVVVMSGRTPARDMAGEPLTTRLWDGETVEGKVALGEGVAVRLGESVGRQYWGKIEQVAVYGNTPPVPVEAADPARTPQNRRALRLRADRALRDAGVTLPVELSLDSGNVHASLHRDTDGGHILFLVHKGKGRIYDVPVRFNLGLKDTTVEMVGDFEQEHTVSVDSEGRATLPAFSHSALVRIPTGG